MLVKFEINPNHPAPLHVKEWIRYQVLKKIDDFRFNILRRFNEDMVGPGLELLKFCFLAEFGRPVYETVAGRTASGVAYSYERLASYDTIVDAFDIPKEAFEAEYKKWIQWAALLNGKVINNLSTLRTNPATLMPSLTLSDGRIVFADIAALQRNNFFTVDRAVGKFEPNGFFYFARTPSDITTAASPSVIPVPDSPLNEWNVITYPDAPKLLQLFAQMHKMFVDDTSISAQPSYATAVAQMQNMMSNRNQYLFNGTSSQFTAWEQARVAAMNNGTAPTFNLYVPTETSAGVWQNIVRKVRYYTLPTRRFGTVNIYNGIVDTLYAGKKTDLSQINKLNPTAKLLFNLPGQVLPQEIAFYFPLGQARIRNAVLMSDAFKNFDLLMIDFNDTISDQIDNFTLDQAALDELIEDIKNGMFTHETMNDRMVSYYYEFGVKKPFLCPVTGVHISVFSYIAEIQYEAQQKAEKIVQAIDDVVNVQLAKNAQAFAAAQDAYMRGEALLKGPEALAEYEKKLNTGVFYFQNGVSYWRPFTVDEAKAFQIMKDEALRNKQIAEQNEQTAIANKLALDAVNAEVAASNENKIKLATLMVENEFDAEMKAQAAALVVPNLGQLIKRARELSMNAPETLEKWLTEHPFIVYAPEKVAQAEQLMKDVIALEEKVATAMVADTLSEARFTQALTELFKVG